MSVRYKWYWMIFGISGSVIIFIILLTFLHRRYINLQIANIQKKQSEAVRKREKELKQELEDLINQQATNSLTRTSKISSTKQKSLLGLVNLNIIYAYPPSVDKNKITPLIQVLNQNNAGLFKVCYIETGCMLNASLSYLNTYVKKQGVKYNQLIQVDLRTYGPLMLKDLEKVGNMNYVWGKDPFATSKLQDAFEELIKQNKLNIDKDSSVIFLYFDDSFTQTSQADQSDFYEHKKFRSFASDTKNRAYANIYNFDASFSLRAVEIILHEFLHLYGASDKYKENPEGKPCNERGRGEPDKIPLFPQTTADIMCFYIEKNNNEFFRGSIGNYNLIINRYTAEEIGWTN